MLGFGCIRKIAVAAALVAVAAGSAVGATDITEKFVDAKFRAEVYRMIGKTAPAPILDSDVSGITLVDVSGDYYERNTISDLSGIEYFTALTFLNCGYNQLTVLDVSKNTALTVLYCSDNQLTALDVANNTALNELSCDYQRHSGYIFGGWYRDSTYTDKWNGSIFPNLTLYAKWTSRAAVSSSDRIIPAADHGSGLTAIAPSQSAPVVEFAAGPNPVIRSSGAVVFFRSGAVIKSADLSVYDASGNVVRRISVNDGGAVGGGQSSRKVASWDLRDAGGRTVSAGTYLVKGTVKTKSGKSEKVSLAVGVR